MNKEFDQMESKSIETNTEQEEICKAIGYKKELDFLYSIMGVSK